MAPGLIPRLRAACVPTIAATTSAPRVTAWTNALIVCACRAGQRLRTSQAATAAAASATAYSASGLPGPIKYPRWPVISSAHTTRCSCVAGATNMPAATSRPTSDSILKFTEASKSPANAPTTRAWPASEKASAICAVNAWPRRNSHTAAASRAAPAMPRPTGPSPRNISGAKKEDMIRNDATHAANPCRAASHHGVDGAAASSAARSASRTPTSTSRSRRPVGDATVIPRDPRD